jgi:hypothetical protein
MINFSTDTEANNDTLIPPIEINEEKKRKRKNKRVHRTKSKNVSVSNDYFSNFIVSSIDSSLTFPYALDKIQSLIGVWNNMAEDEYLNYSEIIPPKSRKRKKQKDPNRPKGPSNAWIFFHQAEHHRLNEFPSIALDSFLNLSTEEQTKFQDIWDTLPPSEKEGTTYVIPPKLKNSNLIGDLSGAWRVYYNEKINIDFNEYGYNCTLFGKSRTEFILNRWRSLTPEEQKPWYDMGVKDRNRYKDEMDIYYQTRPEKKPKTKRVRNAYHHFYNEYKLELKNEDLTPAECRKKISDRWKQIKEDPNLASEYKRYQDLATSAKLCD